MPRPWRRVVRANSTASTASTALYTAAKATAVENNISVRDDERSRFSLKLNRSGRAKIVELAVKQAEIYSTYLNNSPKQNCLLVHRRRTMYIESKCTMSNITQCLIRPGQSSQMWRTAINSIETQLTKGSYSSNLAPLRSTSRDIGSQKTYTGLRPCQWPFRNNSVFQAVCSPNQGSNCQKLTNDKAYLCQQPQVGLQLNALT